MIRVTRTINNPFSMANYTTFTGDTEEQALTLAFEDTVYWADETDQYDLAEEMRMEGAHFGEYGRGLVEFERD